MANVTYTFTPKSTTQSVLWSDEEIWIGGVVPNSLNAAVIMPTAMLAAGGIYSSLITISKVEAFAVASLEIADQTVEIIGQLSVASNVTLHPGAVIYLDDSILNVGSLLNNGNGIHGSGELFVAGLLVNNTSIAGKDLNLTATVLTNNGTLGTGSGDLVVNITPDGFTNLNGTTLSGGTYAAHDGHLYLNAGNLIVENAANIILGLNGTIFSYDALGDSYLPLEATLQSIAPLGNLALEVGSFDWGVLSIDGVLSLQNATLMADQLTVGATGQITGSGTIMAPIVNSGVIFVSGSLDIEGLVTGPGTIVIAPGRAGIVPPSNVSVLELSTPNAQDVVFSNNVGTVIIDNPASFTGTVAPSSLINQHSTGDVIILNGLSLAGLLDHSYEGDATGGMLSLYFASGKTDLRIVGDFNAGSFNFSAGPQFLTTSPPSLQITVGGTVKLLSDTGASSSDYITANPTIIQKAYPNAAVQLTIDGSPLPNYIWADVNGVWSYMPVGLADGTHTIVATEFTGGYRGSTDTLGTASLTFTLDTQLSAYSDAYVVLSGQSLTASADESVLANDVTQSSATVTLSTGPMHGALQLGSDGSFTYSPAEGFTGIDVFTYLATAENGAAAEAQAVIYSVPLNVGPSTTLNLVGLTAEEQIAATYAAFFGRGADATGFEFWVNQFTLGSNDQTPAALFANIASSFGVSGEAQGLYPFLTHPEGATDGQIGSFLESVYNNLFNRSSDAEGLAYWTDQIKQTLAKGEFVGSVLVNIMSGAQNSPAGQDVTTLMGKVAVGLEYVHQQEQHNTLWAGASDIAAATSLLHSVTADPLSVLIGIQNADDLVWAHT